LARRAGKGGGGQVGGGGGVRNSAGGEPGQGQWPERIAASCQLIRNVVWSPMTPNLTVGLDAPLSRKSYMGASPGPRQSNEQNLLKFSVSG